MAGAKDSVLCGLNLLKAEIRFYTFMMRFDFKSLWLIPGSVGKWQTPMFQVLGFLPSSDLKWQNL